MVPYHDNSNVNKTPHDLYRDSRKHTLTASPHRQGLKIIEMQIHLQRENLNENASEGVS